MPGIISYCHIKRNSIFLNEKLLLQIKDAADLKTFAVHSFKQQKIQYPKFFKMDEISKLGFLAAEILLKDLKEKPGTDTGIVLSNAASTLVTDAAFQESINSFGDFYPSPSVFVYTLPNIMIGEISIRHKFRGENAFFIFDRFNGEFIADYINLLFLQGKVNNCLGGWVEQSENGFEAFMYLAGLGNAKETAIEHNALEVKKLYEII